MSRVEVGHRSRIVHSPSDRDRKAHTAHESLSIAYVFMRYPMASQPFAISDVQGLEALGHRVDVYALSGRDREHRKLLDQYEIQPGRRSHWSWRTAAALTRPGNWAILRTLLVLLWRHRDGRVGTFIKALLVAPRLVEITAAIRREPVDVIHAFWGHYPSLILPLAAQFAPSCRLSIFLGAYDLTSHFIPHCRAALDVCDTVWTHSEANRPMLKALGVDAQRIIVVPRGIPLHLARDALPARRPHLICTASNLQKEKNIDLVLRVFRHVRESVPQAALLVAGDGAERSALERLAAELGIRKHVTFTGHLSRDQLFRRMAEAKVFLFLSGKVSERLPNVVKEAMLAECHCIVSETPGIRELITPGMTGEIVAELEPERVASQVVAALQTNEPTIGRAASSFIRENMSTEAAMKRYAEGWRRTIRSDNRAVPPVP